MSSTRHSALRDAMDRAVIAPDDESYDDARKVWKADIDRRPAAVAVCGSADDVAAAVRFAQQEAPLQGDQNLSGR
jgi:FAD/FMN-containing dehydrogenase